MNVNRWTPAPEVQTALEIVVFDLARMPGGPRAACLLWLLQALETRLSDPAAVAGLLAELRQEISLRLSTGAAQAAALQRLPALAASPELAALYQAGYYDALHAIGVACGLNPQEMRLPDPDPRQQRAR